MALSLTQLNKEDTVGPVEPDDGDKIARPMFVALLFTVVVFGGLVVILL